MEQYQELISLIALTMGVSWASGINLYAALLVLGIGGATNNIQLPENLMVLQDPMVIGAAGLMYCVEFFADKVPGVDTGWDSLHTFVRIPAGALLAASSVGDVTPALEIAAGIMGGFMAAASHAAKAGSRVLITTSPEPVTNWTASISEDLLVFGGLWAALNHPVFFLAGLLVFIVLLIWLLPKLWRAIKAVFTKIGQWLGLVEKTVQDNAVPNNEEEADSLSRIQQLKALLDDGAITQDEFDAEKKKLLAGGPAPAS